MTQESSILKMPIPEANAALRRLMMTLADPAGWDRTRALMAESLRALEGAEWLAGIEQVILVGHGTSYATALNVESFVARMAKVPARALPAFQFAQYSGEYLLAPAGTLVVGVTCSGNTASVVHSLSAAKAAGAATMVLSGEGDFAAAAHADGRIVTDAHLEVRLDAPAYTVSHMYLALAGFELALLLGRKKGTLDDAGVAYWRGQFEAMTKTLTRLPGLFETLRAVSARFAAGPCHNCCVVGTGPNVGTAKEGALKIAEMAWLFAAGEELEDFAHGRFRELDESTPLFILAPRGPACSKTLDLLAASVTTGTPTVVFTDAANEAMRRLATLVVEMPAVENELLTPFLYVWPLWFYGWQVMDAAGGRAGGIRYDLFSKDIDFAARFDETGAPKVGAPQ